MVGWLVGSFVFVIWSRRIADADLFSDGWGKNSSAVSTAAELVVLCGLVVTGRVKACEDPPTGKFQVALPPRLRWGKNSCVVHTFGSQKNRVFLIVIENEFSKHTSFEKQHN